MIAGNESARPFCFVLAPSGRVEAAGRYVDGDALVAEVIAPAVAAAGLELVRLDATALAGDGADRLAPFRFGVAEVATAPPCLLRAIGRWEGWRATRAVLLRAGADRSAGAPVDVVARVGPDGRPAAPTEAQAALVLALEARRAEGEPVPPLCHLLDGLPPREPERFKTDRFRQTLAAPEPWGGALGRARQLARDERAAAVVAMRDVEVRLAPLAAAPHLAAVDLLLSYRAASAWLAIVALVPTLDPALARTALVREQHAMALNRIGRSDEAIGVLTALLAERGPSSETLGLLGRVHKDRWDAARHAGDRAAAAASLGAAIDAYARGFEADARDVYPGINAATLMELADPPDPRRLDILPVIDYVLARRIAQGGADYWDHASVLEVAVLRRREAHARAALAAALPLVREPWEPQSTADSLRRIDDARRGRGEPDVWLAELLAALDAAAA